MFSAFAETTFLLKELISQHALSYPDVLVKRSDSPYLTFSHVSACHWSTFGPIIPPKQLI